MPEVKLTLDAVAKALEKAVPGAVLDQIAFDEDDRLVIAADKLHAVCDTLKNDAGLAFNLLAELTAVDYIDEDPRFEVVYQLFSMSNNYRLRLKVRVNEDDALKTVSDVWRVADPLEREVFDMFGLRFDGHPNLKRILMYDQFEGHPLRKDYPLKKHQPIVPLRVPIETEDDPAYMWTETQRKRKLGLND